MEERIIIYDFGSQYTQLIARKIRELNVYCEILPYNLHPESFAGVKGFVLSGSPYSVHNHDAPVINLEKIKGCYPVLGICYGAQLLAHNYGGQVLKSDIREYGRANLKINNSSCSLFQNIPDSSQVWMSHGDTICNLPEGYTPTASTETVNICAFKIEDEPTYGIQFHPEVYHTVHGKEMLKNFLTLICGCKQNWTPAKFVEATVKELSDKTGNDKVVLGLSGGVDSSVAAYLLNRAIGKNLHCIFVNNGLLRKNEYQSVLETYKNTGLNVHGVDASVLFIERLKGVADPEKKRKIIGNTFIDVFESEAKKIKDVKWLAQGTIYPDVIESLSVNGPSATIKSHHNVGGLPEKMNLKIIEPLRLLFKDEVRKAGNELGVPAGILQRHPFPGPGLAIRIIGNVTEEKIRLVQEADYIFISMLKERGLYDSVWQALAVLLPVHSVGVMGDERTYEQVLALRAVQSTDGMTADFVHLPYEFLADVSNCIINNVKGINRVVYDISSKPPSTIEWE